MKKTTDARDVGSDSERGPSESPLVVPFRISKLEKIGPFGSKIAAGSLEIEGLGSLNFECFLRNSELGVAPESVRSKFTGAYTRTFVFEAAFRASLEDAVRARLDAEIEPE